ncbi:hypothetical protein AB0M36_19590 [Actinoplanes sp. NPDC051346]|uniref:hypothetical protein n=1 Tax=Actinoplanes sp. NPDC051346 TaxID=3155048 RepID=UPI00343E6829
MRERRGARIGTVSGLAVLVGGTAITAVAGGAHSIFATLLLGMLATGLGHALLTEIQRQARRHTVSWTTPDTINAVLLAAWAVVALVGTILAVVPLPVRAVGLLLAFGYALSAAYFITERRRTITRIAAPATGVPAAAESS